MRNCCAWLNRWHHEETTLCTSLEATSQFISKEVKVQPEKSQMDNNPRHTAKLDKSDLPRAKSVFCSNYLIAV